MKGYGKQRKALFWWMMGRMTDPGTITESTANETEL